MKNLNQFGMITGAAFMLLLAVTGVNQLIAIGHWLGTYGVEPKAISAVNIAPTGKKQSTVSAKELQRPVENRGQVERVIKNYLIRNPEILMQAMRVYEEREQAKKSARNKRLLVQFKKPLLSSKHDVVWNNAGKIPVVEFFDYQCGYCKQVYAAVQKIKKENKNVRLIYKEFPILGPVSVFAAKASLAANKQGKYFEFHHALMTHQGKLSEKVVMQKAASVGLDVFRLTKDMKNPKIQEGIDRNLVLARAMGINGTPTLILGDELVPGAIAYRQMTRLIDIAAKGCTIC